MGYYTNIDLDGLDVIDFDGLEKAYKTIKEDNIYKSLISISKNCIALEDYYLKYYEDEWENIFEVIAPYVEGQIIFCGEDNENWAYTFENGTFQYSQETSFFNFNAYETFMDYYNDEIPPDLKKQMQDWWIARKV